jgi:hypothetical protein
MDALPCSNAHSVRDNTHRPPQAAEYCHQAETKENTPSTIPPSKFQCPLVANQQMECDQSPHSRIGHGIQGDHHFISPFLHS